MLDETGKFILENCGSWIYTCVVMILGDRAEKKECLLNIICPNSDFLSFYSILFTLIVGLIFYIYQIQDKREKFALGRISKIEELVRFSIMGLAITFINLGNTTSLILNLFFGVFLLYRIFDSFRVVFEFNKDNLSASKMTKEELLKVISLGSSTFEATEKENEKLTKESYGGIGIVRFFWEENEKDKFEIIKAPQDGIVKINFNNLRSNIIMATDSESSTSKRVDSKSEIYVPYGVFSGSEIKTGNDLYGVLKQSKIIHEGFITVTDKEENILQFIEKEIYEVSNNLVSSIREENIIKCKNELSELKVFFESLGKLKSYRSGDYLQNFISEYLRPLQNTAFLTGNFEIIREVISFTVSFIYSSINNKEIKNFTVFMNNIRSIFANSYKIKDMLVLRELYDSLNSWIYEISEYSLRPKLKKNNNKDDADFSMVLINSLGSVLKIIQESNTGDYNIYNEILLEKLLYLFNKIYNSDWHSNEIDKNSEITKYKRAILFGYATCFYRTLYRSEDEIDYKTLEIVLKSLGGELGNAGDYLINLFDAFSTAYEIENKDGKNMMWDNLSSNYPRGHLGMMSGTITTSQDLQKLFVDRLNKYIAEGNEIDFESIKFEFYGLSNLNIDFKFLFSNRNKDASTVENSEKGVKKILEIITKNYNTKQKYILINKELSKPKIKIFFTNNINEYKRNKLVRKLSKLTSTENKIIPFGYNLFYPREAFIDDAQTHFINNETFGEGLARTENNLILEDLIKDYSKRNKIEDIDILDLSRYTQNFDNILFFSNDYSDLSNIKDFTPYWQVNQSSERESMFEGEINGKPLYRVYKLPEIKLVGKYMILLKKDGLQVSEELPILNKSGSFSYLEDDLENEISMIIDDLARADNEHLKKIAENNNEESDVESYKSNVTVRFFKGSKYTGFVNGYLKVYRII